MLSASEFRRSEVFEIKRTKMSMKGLVKTNDTRNVMKSGRFCFAEL